MEYLPLPVDSLLEVWRYHCGFASTGGGPQAEMDGRNAAAASGNLWTTEV